MSFRAEFSLSKLGFQDTCRERFLTFHWRLPGIIYVFYRFALAAYTLTILIRDIKHSDNSLHHGLTWLAYLTEWTYIMLTVYFCYHAFVTLAVYNSCQGLKLKLLDNMDFTEHKYLFRELYVMPNGYQQANVTDDDPMDIIDRSDKIPWYLSLLWILFSITSVFAFVVSIGFWTLLAPEIGVSYLVSEQNLQIHLINSILVLLELSLTAIPVRLLHAIYPFVYGMIYVLFALIYWSVDHKNVVYPFLDFGKSPGITAASILVIGFVVIPLLQLLIYGLYRLKLKLFHHFCWN